MNAIVMIDAATYQKQISSLAEVMAQKLSLIHISEPTRRS